MLASKLLLEPGNNILREEKKRKLVTALGWVQGGWAKENTVTVTIAEEEAVQVVFLDRREFDLLALAKGRITENDCDNHCVHRRRAAHAPGAAWDPTACRHFALNGYMWCDGYEQEV